MTPQTGSFRLQSLHCPPAIARSPAQVLVYVSSFTIFVLGVPLRLLLAAPHNEQSTPLILFRDRPPPRTKSIARYPPDISLKTTTAPATNIYLPPSMSPPIGLRGTSGVLRSVARPQVFRAAPASWRFKSSMAHDGQQQVSRASQRIALQ